MISATVPLATMFGYATDLRSMTQGRATYTMEFKHYAEVPASIADGGRRQGARWVTVVNATLFAQACRRRVLCRPLVRQSAALLFV